MDLMKLRKVGNWMMIIGGCVFTGGAGINLVTSLIEHGNSKREHADAMLMEERKEQVQKHEKHMAEIKAKTAKDEALAERLKTMSDKEFAKYHAESVAKANQEVLDKADLIRKAADNDISRAKLDCSDRIMKIEKECSKKVEEANEKYLEAKRKYDAIDELFTNKEEIMRIHKQLKDLTDKREAENEAKDELAKKIAALMS